MSGCASRACLFTVFISAQLVSVAQQPNQSTPPPKEDALLHNTGGPMRVPFACTEDDLQMAGLLCTDSDPCPIYLELNAITSAGKKLFLAGDLHAASASLASILIGSDDGGATWKEPSARVRAADLDEIQFYDLEHGWAAGETQYPLLRDPFFLVTTDGGLSWRQRPVTEEGGPGSIQRFWFDSAQHGELIVDAGRSAPSGRYISYESQTGGESWMVRGTSGQLPKIKLAPASVENPDYRIRADKTSNALHIEKRLGGDHGDKWEPVAAFLIEVANCKIKAPEAKEPPKEPTPETPAADAEPKVPTDYVEELRIGGPPKAPGNQKSPKKQP
jgi:hypothetical protein